MANENQEQVIPLLEKRIHERAEARVSRDLESLHSRFAKDPILCELRLKDNNGSLPWVMEFHPENSPFNLEALITLLRERYRREETDKVLESITNIAEYIHQ